MARCESRPGTANESSSSRPNDDDAAIIRRARERLAGGGEIEIRIDSDDDGVVIVISNPMPTEPVGASTGHNVGLPASLAQIEAFTEGRGSVVASAADGRFTVTVKLPAQA